MTAPSTPEVDRLAEALARLLADWWRARQSGNDEVAETEVAEVRTDDARPVPG